MDQLEHQSFKNEEKAAETATSADLATTQNIPRDSAISEESTYHVDYCRDISTFQLSDLTTGVGERATADARPHIVVNLAQTGSQVFIRPSYVKGKELRTLWDTGAGCSYVHKDFSNLGRVISGRHYVRSVFANGQAHTSNELVQLSVLLGPGNRSLEQRVEVKVKVIPMDLPKSYDLIFGCDVMKQLQASLDVDRNTILLKHNGRAVTLIMNQSKTGETSPVRDLALVNTGTTEQQARHPVSFSTLEEEFGPFHTALFIPMTSGLAPLSYEEPVETMCLDWRNLPGPILCVPPLRLLPQVTQKLKDSTPLDMVLLVPYIPSSPWFKELGPLIEKGRVIPLADKTYTNNGAFHKRNVSVDGMVALQVDRNPPVKETTLSAIQENRATITKTTIENLYLPEYLTTVQQKQLKDLLVKYLHLMQPPGDDEPPPTPSEFDHRIVLTEGGAQRVQTRPIRLAADQTIELQKRFEHRCTRGIMRKAASDSQTCRSAVFMVKRKDGPDRDVVDFRALNEVTVKDHFPLPLIDELLDRLSQASFFISLDLKEAYYNIRMHPESVKYTGTITHFGLFEWLVLVMGMCNAVATFQRMMDARFHHLIYSKRTVACYLDDLLIYGNSFHDMMDTLEEVLQICDRNRFRLNMHKSTWFQTHLTYLGHIIGDGQLRPDTRLVKAVRDFPQPRTPTQLRSFLGLAGYYRKFVPGFQTKASPLYDLTRTAEPLVARWNDQAEAAFVALKLALTSEPVLKLWTPGCSTEIHTDASNIGLGAVLLQQHSTSWHPVAYWSKSLQGAQKNYTTTELEMLAIVLALETWRYYLLGVPVVVRTDHQALVHYLNKRPAKLQQRELSWLPRLADFQLTIVYKPGKCNLSPDALSRRRPELHLTVLDLCAGTGTVIRSLARTVPEHVRINYIAVDINPDCRKVIQRIFSLVQREHPKLFLRNDIFRWGNNVEELLDRRLSHIDLLIAGVPCQPFSKANPEGKGLQDERSLFQATHNLIMRRQPTFYAIECTPFAPHLAKDLNQVEQWFGQPTVHDLSKWSAQNRTRLLWSNLNTDNLVPHPTDLAQPLTWQDCLQTGWLAPSVKAPTLMASWSNTHNVRSGQSLVGQKGSDNKRHMTPEERELLVGLQPGDTAAPGVDKAARNRMLGNAFPVSWINTILRIWVETTDNTASQAAACYPLSSPGAQDSPFYQAMSNPKQPQRTIFTAVDIGKISQLDALLVKAALSDTNYQQLANTDKLEAVGDLKYMIVNGQRRLYVPDNRTVKNLILMTAHDLPYAGHPGIQKTTELVTRQYYWPGMHADIKNYCKQCYACQLGKISRQRHRTKIHSTDHGSYPNRWVTLDIAMGLPSSHQHDAVLVIVDRFTKYTAYVPITTTISATELAFRFEQHWVSKRGCPVNLIMDRDTKFTSVYWRDFMEALGITARLTTAYHQQSDGQTERQIATLADILRVAIIDTLGTDTDWYRYLHVAEFATNNTIRAATGVTPFQAELGRHPTMPFYLLPGPSDRTLDQHIRELCQHHKTVYRKMAINIANAEISMKRFSDRYRTTKLFQEGEIVKLQTGRATRADQSKLQPRFRVTEIVRSLGKDNYEIRLPEGSNIHPVVHAEKLEKFWSADRTKFPIAQQPEPSILPTHTSAQLPEKGTYPIRKYLLRNWTNIPPRYYVQWDTPSKDLGWAYENSALISDIIVYEKVNGILPETGITKANTAAVRSHKQTKYHQKWPILHNTWTGKAPWAAAVGRTATVKRTKLDASPELNLHRVVQKQFTEQGLLMYYAGEVIATPTTTKGKYTLRYTDAYEEKVTHQQLGELLYKASTRID